MSDAVAVVGASGDLLLTNPVFDRLFGAGHATGRWTDEAGTPLADEQLPLRRAAQGESFGMQFMLVDDEGRRRYFEARCDPIQLDEHDRGGVVVIRDMTDRSLRRLQDQFLTTASHELRTPLTVVHGYLGMMQRAVDVSSNARLRNYVDLALSQTRRMEELIEELLDVARLQRGRIKLALRPLDLVPVVANAVQLAQSMTHTQTITFEPPDGPLIMNGDAGRIQQVLLSLVTNAVTFGPDATTVAIRLYQTESMACVEVQDYGPGIAEEDLHRLFAPFFQSDANLPTVQNGLGLGLFVSKELVTAHGGTIDVSSAVGTGTTFTLRFPLYQEATAGGAEPRTKESSPTATDDDHR